MGYRPKSYRRFVATSAIPVSDESEVINRVELELKRDELITELFKQGYTTQQLRVIFNKHPEDIEKIIKRNEGVK